MRVTLPLIGVGVVLLVFVGCASSASRPRPRPRPAEPAAAAVFEPSPMYEALFDDGATFWYRVVLIEEEDDTGENMRCRVSEVRRYPGAVAARLTCAGAWAANSDDDNRRSDENDGAAPHSLAVPLEVQPAGVYVATADGLFRTAVLPDYGATPQPDPDALVMLPKGTALTIREEETHTRALYQSEHQGAWWCWTESVGGDWPDEGRSVSLCFRPGAGLVGGGYTMTKADQLYRGHYELADMRLGRARDEGAPDARALVINEVSAGLDPTYTFDDAGKTLTGDPDDWFEVVNVSGRSIQLDDFVYTDRANDFARVVAFPTTTLAPGAYHVQRVNLEQSGFRLNGTESLSIYRSADHARSDSVAWEEGESPPGGSFARVPDVTGPFGTVTLATAGRTNAVAPRAAPAAPRRNGRGAGRSGPR